MIWRDGQNQELVCFFRTDFRYCHLKGLFGGPYQPVNVCLCGDFSKYNQSLRLPSAVNKHKCRAARSAKESLLYTFDKH